ncbi:methyltransferase domain-containing protein [Candidatus Woesearchaeota archaeon]|nr:methyltransferase domain-containing protein [Candidatus Woesearchaeota archaeon]
MQEKELNIEEKIKKAIETYNKYASIYAEHTKNKLLQFQLAKFVSMLPKKGKVLDAGCGPGRDTAYLQEDGLDVVAVDISEGMIEEAKKNDVKAIKGDLLNIISNEEFDGIWCMATLADIPKSHAKKLIQNFYKALKKEGIMYIAVKEGEGEELIEKERYWNSPRFYAFYKKDELNQLLKENGFEIIELSNSNDEGTNWIEVFAKKI